MKPLLLSEALEKYNIDSSNYIHESVLFIETDSNSGIRIGKNNIIAPGCVIWSGTEYRTNTLIGSNNYIGPNTVIKSDSILGSNNYIESNMYLGLHSCIQDYTKIESSVSISDYSTVGSFAYIGTLTPIIKDVMPFSKVFGNPATLKGFNSTKTVTDKFNSEQIKEIFEFIKNNKEFSDIFLISILDSFFNQSRKKHIK